MAKPTLLLDPACLHLKLLDASDSTITAVVMTTASEGFCQNSEEGLAWRSFMRYAESNDHLTRSDS
jgi:hypothetical protein